MKLSPSFTAAVLATIVLQGCASITHHNENADYQTLPQKVKAELSACFHAELPNDHSAEIKQRRPELDKAMRGMMAGTDEEYEVLANDSLNDYVSRRICAEKLKIDMDSIPVPMPG